VLDVSLHAVSFRYDTFALRGVDLVCAASTHTAVTGPAGCGSTTLLRLISGDIKPDSGIVQIGTRDVTRMRRSQRPLLFATSDPDVPRWWTVRHALIAAVRRRKLDRVDRQHEYRLALEKWRLEALAGRRVSTLSQSEKTLMNVASIELRKPGILVADRLFAAINPALLRWAAGEFFRTLRVMGTTVIAAPATTIELGWADRVAIFDRGTVLQIGRPAHVYVSPLDDAAAIATGDLNVIPVAIRGTTVESLIGAWELPEPPFQGAGVALARPGDFTVARRGDESDLIFSVEEASFEEGSWKATGILSGGFLLRVALPRGEPVEKGKLLPLQYDPSRFALIAREIDLPRSSAPLDVVPPLRDTR
jgi:ABC-type sugar transport system ATPase subunit